MTMRSTIPLAEVRYIEKAIARAEEMRIAKLKSLDKQAKKFSAMVFKIAP